MALLSRGLLPASFRGVPFAVLATEEQFGRRIAPHVYPGRDEPWMEDMGRAPRTFRIRGFIVANDVVYLGGPIALQRALLTAAAEQAGSGLLTHPTLGVLQVSCRGFSLSEDVAAGTMSELTLDLIESGKRSFPSLLTSGGSSVLSAANLGKLAVALDVVRAFGGAYASGGERDKIPAAAAQWTDRVTVLGADATAVLRLAAQVPGEFGRYGQGGNAGLTGSTPTVYAADTLIDDLIGAAANARAAIAAAIADLALAMSSLTVGTTEADLAAAVAVVIDRLATACADPADALRLLVRLTTFSPTGRAAETQVGQIVGDMFRRQAALALAAATTTYQPASYDDAFAKLQLVSGRLDAEITIAGDQGLDDTFNGLRAARAAVVQDLKQRGASLSPIRIFTAAAPTPGLTLAQRFYRDAARAEELVRQVDVPHPLFMPTSFQALAA